MNPEQLAILLFPTLETIRKELNLPLDTPLALTINYKYSQDTDSEEPAQIHKQPVLIVTGLKES